jgi:hypothetical protein
MDFILNYVYTVNEGVYFMGVRFRRSVKVAPGVRLNVGKKSASVSFGVKGARHTISTTGRRTTSIGIPGTGLYYTESSSTRANNYSNKNINNYDYNSTYEEVEKFNNTIEFLISLQKNCDYYYNWFDISTEPAPFNILGKGPNELESINNLENYKPNLLEKIFKSKLKKKLKLLESNIEIAKSKDKELYKEWEEKSNLSKLILSGDLDAYIKVLQDNKFLDNFGELVSSFNYSFSNKDTIIIEYNINIEDIIPEQYITATKTGKLSTKNYTKTAYYELTKQYVSGLTIRLARDIFGLLPIKTVIIHTQTNSLNTQTGNIENNTILSIEIDRDNLESLNFDLIDPFDALNNFKHNVKFLKTKGFQPIDKL